MLEWGRFRKDASLELGVKRLKLGNKIVGHGLFIASSGATRVVGHPHPPVSICTKEYLCVLVGAKRLKWRRQLWCALNSVCNKSKVTIKYCWPTVELIKT